MRKTWLREVVALPTAALAIALLFLGSGCSQTQSCEPEASCDGLCADLQSDDAHCGACGRACGAGEVCSDGSCERFCVSGQKLCGETCQGVQSDPERCGSCETACQGDFYCDDGACSAACSGVLCGEPGERRVCAHLESDPGHCGACGNVCEPGLECSQGACIPTCAPDRLRCGDDCVDPLHSAVHCGSCGNACSANVACLLGVCADRERCDGKDCECSTGEAACSGSCIDVSSNRFQCGACDSPCPAAQSCSDGECTCPGSKSLCGGACVELASDERHCGTCGTACASGATCNAGKCECPEGLDVCSDSCVDRATSKKHCGACGVDCSGLEACNDGICFYEADDGCGGRAEDASISKVALFQAVEVPLFQDGALLEPGDRNADVVEGRDALVRIHVGVGANFDSRSLSARLVLSRPGEDPVLLFRKQTVSADSQQSKLDSTFNIEAPAELMHGDTTFHVELVECNGADSAAAPNTRVPETGEGALGAVQTGPVHVVFLPVRYDGRVPDTSPDVIARYAEEVMRMYGTTAVETEVLPPYGNEPSGPYETDAWWDHVLDDIVLPKRAADDPADNVYYFGLIQPTATYAEYCDGCILGIAYVPGGEAAFRVGIGLSYGDANSALTFAHELGHNHELEHTPCGDASDPDPNWPKDAAYQEARIGTWGYDFVTALLKNPQQHRDLMSYCEPAWISDYSYRGIITTISSLHESSTSFARLAPPTTWAVIRVGAHQASWGQPMPFRPSAQKAADVGVVYDKTGQVLEQVSVYRFNVSEGHGYRLLVPPQQPGWYAVGLWGDVALPYPEP